MPISNCQLPIEKQPFAEREKRTLQLRAERIDPKYLVKGKPPKVEAEHKRAEKHPTHESLYYEIQGLGTGDLGLGTAKIQLNHGNPSDDEARLTAIAEDLLTAEVAGGCSPSQGEIAEADKPITDY